MQLQFYIKNITTCLGKVDFLSESIWYHQWYSPVRHYFKNIFFYRLQQDSTRLLPYKPNKNIFIIMYTPKNTWYESSENINPSTEAQRINKPTPPFASKKYSENPLQSMFDIYDKRIEALLGGRHKGDRSRGTYSYPTSLKHQKGEGQIAADMVLNIGI